MEAEVRRLRVALMKVRERIGQVDRVMGSHEAMHSALFDSPHDLGGQSIEFITRAALEDK